MNIGLVTLARKGSKRIPGKNFKDFCGKPLIHYTLETMKQLKHDSYIMTDFDEIKNYTKEKFKDINIIDMPEEFGRDKHEIMGSLNHIHEIAQKDIYVLLQATSPLRDSAVIEGWIKDFIDKKMRSGTAIFRLPAKYFYYINRPLNFIPSERDGNGCEKDPIYYETGSFYIYKKEDLKEKHVLNPPWALYRDGIGIDLDTNQDWVRGEQLKSEFWDKRK